MGMAHSPKQSIESEYKRVDVLSTRRRQVNQGQGRRIIGHTDENTRSPHEAARWELERQRQEAESLAAAQERARAYNAMTEQRLCQQEQMQRGQQQQ